MIRFLKVILFLFILIISISENGYSQKPVVSEAQLKKEADKYFDSQNYEQALPEYSRLLSLYPHDATYNYRFGVCLLLAGKEKANAATYLDVASKDPSVPDDVQYYLGRSLMINNEFSKAKNAFSLFKMKSIAKQSKYETDRWISNCDNGSSLIVSRKDVLFLNSKPAAQSDFYNSYDFDNAGGKIVAGALQFYFPEDKKGSAPLMYMGNDKQTVFISSYGKKNTAGKDIYIVRRTPDNQWAAPENLGSSVNTSEDEDFPFLDRDGKTLYFSSKGHNSIGGYDIFKSVYDFNSGKWSEPQNLGIPVNTVDDDYLYVLGEKNNLATYSTTFEAEKNTVLIKSIEYPGGNSDLLTISGTYIPLDQKVRRDARISIMNNEGDAIISSVHTDPVTGKYELNLAPGQTYMIVVEGGGYLPHSERFELPGNLIDPELKQVVKVNREDRQEELTLQNYFSSGVTTLDPTSTVSNSYSAKDTSKMIEVKINDQVVMVTPPSDKKAKEAAADLNETDNGTDTTGGGEIAQESDVEVKRRDKYDPTLNKRNSASEIRQKAEEEKRSQEIEEEEKNPSKMYDINISNDELAKIAYSDAQEIQEEADSLERESIRLKKESTEKENIANDYKLKSGADGITQDSSASLMALSEGAKTESELLLEQAEALARLSAQRENESRSALNNANEIFNPSASRNVAIKNKENYSQQKSDQPVTAPEKNDEITVMPHADETNVAKRETGSDSLSDVSSDNSLSKELNDTSNQKEILASDNPENKEGKSAISKRKEREEANSTIPENNKSEANKTAIDSLTNTQADVIAEAEIKKEDLKVENSYPDSAKIINSPSADETASGKKLNSNSEKLYVKNYKSNDSLPLLNKTEKISGEPEIKSQAEELNDLNTNNDKVRLSSDKHDATALKKAAQTNSADTSFEKTLAVNSVVSDNAVKLNNSSAENSPKNPDNHSGLSDSTLVLTTTTTENVKSENAELNSSGNKTIDNDSVDLNKNTVNNPINGSALNNQQAEINNQTISGVDSSSEITQENKIDNASTEINSAELKNSSADNLAKNNADINPKGDDIKPGNEYISRDTTNNNRVIAANDLSIEKKTGTNQGDEENNTVKPSGSKNSVVKSISEYPSTVIASPEKQSVSDMKKDKADRKDIPEEIKVNAEAKANYLEYKEKIAESNDLSSSSINLQAQIEKMKVSPRRDSLILESNQKSAKSAEVWQEGLSAIERARAIDPSIEYKMEVNEAASHAHTTESESAITVLSDSLNSGRNNKSIADKSQSNDSSEYKTSENHSSELNITANSSTDINRNANTLSADKNSTGEVAVDTLHSEYPAYVQLQKEITAKQIETIDVFAEAVNYNKKAVETKQEEVDLLDRAQNEPSDWRRNNLLKQADRLKAQSESSEKISKEKFTVAQQRTKDVKALNSKLKVVQDKIAVSNKNRLQNNSGHSSGTDPENNSITSTEMSPAHSDVFAMNERAEKSTNVKESEIAAANTSTEETDDFVRNTFSFDRDAEVYSRSNPIPIDKELPEGLVFKVQIGAFHKPIPDASFRGIRPVSGENTRPGWIRYCVGLFKTFEPANIVKKEMQVNGFKDAFVVAYYNGKRIDLKQAYAMAQDKNNLVAYRSESAKELAMLRKLEIGTKNISLSKSDNDASSFYGVKSAVAPSLSGVMNTDPNAPVEYAVQLGVYKTEKAPTSLASITAVQPEFIRTNRYRFTTGKFSDYSSADSARRAVVKSGVKDAFIVYYRNGVALSSNEVPLAMRKSASKLIVTPDVTGTRLDKEIININADKSDIETSSVNSYRVQIGAYRNNIPPQMIKAYLNVIDNGISRMTDDRGLHIFFVGNFSDLNSANALRNEVLQKGITDAFVVVVRNGKKFPVTAEMKK